MTDLTSRQAEVDDLPAVLELLRESMGRQDDPRFEALFRWKHLENAFGVSPMWVSCAGERIVGLRVLMRWEFQLGDEVLRCVRAVDTATHPEFQGRGIFTSLTLAALPVLEAEGVQFVFNTPNTQSLPGYLKMGWQTIGRAEARVRPLSFRGAVALARSRVPARHWSEDADFGTPVGELLADPGLAALLAESTDPRRLGTRITPEFLEWRYNTPLLGYRAVVAPSGIDGGAAIVRVRRRGRAREVVVATLLTRPRATTSSVRALLGEVRRAARGHADYLLGIGDLPRFARVPNLGPVVAARTVCRTPPATIGEFRLSLGDVELF